MKGPLSENSNVNIKLGLFLTGIVTFGSVVGVGTVMRADILRALTVIESQQKTILELQLQMQENSNDIKNFRQQYERDFNKYIR